MLGQQLPFAAATVTNRRPSGNCTRRSRYVLNSLNRELPSELLFNGAMMQLVQL
jgi:hypothetical protein